MMTLRVLGIAGAIAGVIAALFCAKYFMITKNKEENGTRLKPSLVEEQQFQRLTRIDPVRVGEYLIYLT
jgi:hypothetical protein